MVKYSFENSTLREAEFWEGDLMVLPETPRLAELTAQLKAATERIAFATKTAVEEAQRQQLAQAVASLKDVPREIRARWPDCDFIRRPAWLESWSPSPDATSDPPWLPHAIQWHKTLRGVPELAGQADYLQSFDFDELMEFIDNMSKLRLGQMADRWNVRGWAVNAQIVSWGPQAMAGAVIYGFLIKSHGEPVKNLEIGSFWIGKYRFDFRGHTRSILAGQPDLFMLPTITDTNRVPHQTILPTRDFLHTLLADHGPCNGNGFMLGTPLRLYYQGINGGRMLMKRHELRLRGTQVDIHNWPVEGLYQTAVRC